MQIEPVINEIKTLESGCELSLLIPENLYYFSGHFTDHPILPGVVQLDWAIKLASKHLDFKQFVFNSVEVLKFQEMILPNDIILLTLTKMSDNKFKFTYTSDKGRHATGRVVLK